MAIQFGALLLNIAKNEIQKAVVQKAISSVAKHQAKSAATRASIREGTYRVYKSTRNNRPYTLKEFRRDTKSTEKYLRLLQSRSLIDLFRSSHSIYSDISSRVKYAERLQKLQELQKKYSLNIFDKLIFEMSQGRDGTFDLKTLKTDSAMFFSKYFNDPQTIENFTKAFHEYIEFRVDALERVGFLNRIPDSNVFAVTDIFLDRLENLKLLEKEIPKDINFNKFQSFILNEAARNNGINLDDILKQFKENPDIKNPEQRLSAFKNACEILARYGYLEKTDDKNYKLTEKGVLEIYMQRDLDALEKAIYAYLKENKGPFDLKGFINYLKNDQKLFNSMKSLFPSEKQEKKKGFQFGRYDANFLFAEFENGKLSEDQLKEKVIARTKDPEEAEKQLAIMLKRLQKNVDNEYLAYDEQTKTYSITEKGSIAAEKVRKEVTFTSYDANVVFGYINKNGGSIDLEKLKEYIQSEYNTQEYVEKQQKYLEERFEKNVQAGYLSKDSAGVYRITEKGQEQEQKLMQGLMQRIEEKVQYMKNISLLDSNLTISQLFADVVDRRLANYDKLIFEISQLSKGKFTTQSLIDNATVHYINNLGATKAADDHITAFQERMKERLSAMERVGYITKDGTGEYSITEAFNMAILKQGELREKLFKPWSVDRLSKFHLHLLNQSSNIEGISVDKILEGYITEGVKDPEEKLKITVKALDRLTVTGYLEYKTDGTYRISKKGLEEIYNHRNLNAFEKLVYSHSEKADNVINIEALTKALMENKNISEMLKEKAKTENKTFQFGKYDANVIFREFGKENSLLLKDLKVALAERFKDPSEASGQYDVMQKRIDKLVNHGFVSYDKSTEQFKITDKGLQAAKDVNKTFRFTSYDLNVVFKYVENNGGKITLAELENVLKQQYTDQDYIKKQLEYLEKRFNNNVVAGYLDKDPAGTYALSEQGIQEHDKELLLFKEYLTSKFAEFEKNGLIMSDDSKYFITDFFRNTVDRKVNYFDSVLYEIATDNDGVINFESIKDELKYYLDEDKHESFIEYLKERRESLENVGYILHLKDNTYRITKEFGIIMSERIKAYQEPSKEKKSAEELKITSYDQSIFNAAIEGLIDLKERRTYFNEKYKTRPKEADRQYVMLEGRCNKLAAAGYLEKTDKGFKVLRLPEKPEVKEEPVQEKTKRKEPLETFRITKFDFDNITSSTVDGVWNIEVYKKNNSQLGSDVLANKLVSVQKRLSTLESMELAESIGEGQWKIDPLLIERSKLKSNELTKEQRKLLEDIKDFLNFSDRQITEFIFDGREKISRSDINSLVNKGLLNYQSRDLRGTGEFENIYYVTTAGKKEICKLFDVKMDNLYNSKIHKRPEELRHDVLIYSAYVDVKASLEKDGLKITKFMTDRQMKAYDMSHNMEQRKEYADLYVEFKDEKTGEEGYINIEIDVGYTPAVIAGKAQNLDNLVWYTDSQQQAEKIVKYAKTSNVKVLEY